MIFIKKLFLKFILLGCLCLGGLINIHPSPPITAHATTSIVEVEAFDNLTGDSKYIQSQYKENYYLDIEETGLLEVGDKIFNQVANIIFNIIKWVGSIVTTFFYQVMTLDLSELFSGQLNQIQKALKSNVFDAFFLLAFVGSAWMLFKKISKRDLTGLMMEVGKIICILLLSSLVVTKSSTVLTATTDITKSISISALLNINDPQNSTTSVESYSASASGLLWKSLVHDPWLSLEFGNTKPSSEQVETFLKTIPNTAEREQLVKDYRSEHSSAMLKSEGVSRIGFLIIYLVPFLIKCCIYLFMAVIQLAFQLMAIFYVLLAPIILLLALVPAFGGVELIGTWLKKILESQIMIVVVTFLMGVVMKLDSFLYSKAHLYGWLIVIFMETLVALIVVLNYKSILSGISKIGSIAKHPKALQYELMRSGNILDLPSKQSNRRPLQSNPFQRSSYRPANYQNSDFSKNPTNDSSQIKRPSIIHPTHHSQTKAYQSKTTGYRPPRTYRPYYSPSTQTNDSSRQPNQTHSASHRSYVVIKSSPTRATHSIPRRFDLKRPYLSHEPSHSTNQTTSLSAAPQPKSTSSVSQSKRPSIKLKRPSINNTSDKNRTSLSQQADYQPTLEQIKNAPSLFPNVSKQQKLFSSRELPQRQRPSLKKITLKKQ